MTYYMVEKKINGRRMFYSGTRGWVRKQAQGFKLLAESLANSIAKREGGEVLIIQHV
jgi:hypothetical protein